MLAGCYVCRVLTQTLYYFYHLPCTAHKIKILKLTLFPTEFLLSKQRTESECVLTASVLGLNWSRNSCSESISSAPSRARFPSPGKGELRRSCSSVIRVVNEPRAPKPLKRLPAELRLPDRVKTVSGAALQRERG